MHLGSQYEIRSDDVNKNLTTILCKIKCNIYIPMLDTAITYLTHLKEIFVINRTDVEKIKVPCKNLQVLGKY